MCLVRPLELGWMPRSQLYLIRKRAMVWDYPFFNTVKNILKHFSQHRPIEAETSDCLYHCLLWNSYVHYCSGDPGASLSVPRLHSPPCHKMPCVQALPPPLCWDGAAHLSQSYSGSLTPPAFCKISMSLIWYYHILPSTVPSTVYFMKVFPKVWINAEHWANEQLMAHKLHESSLILSWDLRS